jgi:hypothetical protein
MKLKIAAVYGKHDSISMRSIPIVGYDLHTFVLRAQIDNCALCFSYTKVVSYILPLL